MFGYIRPLAADLRENENKLYEAEYCGICRELRIRYGITASVSLSYDLVFFAEMGRAVGGGKLVPAEKSCPAHPFGRRLCTRCRGMFGSGYAADCGVILTFAKLCDDLRDRAVLPKLRAAVLIPLLFPHYLKARKKRPAVASAAAECIKAQHIAEHSGTHSIDKLCEPTAAMLRTVFRELGGTDPDMRTMLGDMGYMLGRFIYICDALDDLSDDLRTGDFNPFIPQGRKELSIKMRKKAADEAAMSVGLTLSALGDIYSQLPARLHSEIKDNIIYKGLYSVFDGIAEKTLHGKH